MRWRQTSITLGDGDYGRGTIKGGPCADDGIYSISSPFGLRESFIAGGQATSGFHQGLDIAYPFGKLLVTLFRSRIRHVSTNNPMLGNYVVYEPVDDEGILLDVEHPDWRQVWYGHLSTVNTALKEGDIVEAGTWVGNVGDTGMANGAHLHLEIRNRMGPVDPFNLLMLSGTPDVQAPSLPVAFAPLSVDEVIAELRDGAPFADLIPSTNAVMIFPKNRSVQ